MSVKHAQIIVYYFSVFHSYLLKDNNFLLVSNFQVFW